MIQIEIETKIIPQTQKIWVVFSGVRRQHFEQFRRESIIFLDYVSLSLLESTARSMGEIRRHIRMSNSVLEYELGNYAGSPPSLDPQKYSSDVFKERSSTVKAANVNRMYNLLSVGDLVIVPGGAFDPVLFGEIETQFDHSDATSTTSRGVERSVQFRRVKWFRTDVVRSDLPRQLQMYLSKPPAIARVRRDRITEQFFHFAYDSYILRNASFELFRAPNYSGKNPRDTEDANQLVTYFSAAFSAIEKNHLEYFINLSFDDAIEEYFDKDLIDSYSQVLRSPGQLGLLTAAIAMGGFVSICTTVVTSGLDVKHIRTGVDITNSIEPKKFGEQKQLLEEKINPFLKSLSEKELHRLTKKGLRARKNLGLNSRARLK